MLESLMLAQLVGVLKEVAGPLTKTAAEDIYKNLLKQGVQEVIEQNAPESLDKAIKQALKDFFRLFRAELENCGLPGDLVKHELAKPLGNLIANEAVRKELCRAFETDAAPLNWQLLPETWQTLSPPANFPAEFEWEALTRNYVRRVTGLIRKDEDLARQLELDQQKAIKESNAALVGVPVEFNLKQYQESLKKQFGSLSLDSLDSTGAAYDNLRLWKIFVAQDVRECAEFAPQMYELPKERLLELQKAGEIDPLLSLDALEQQRKSYADKPIESVRGVVGLGETRSVDRAVILGDPGSGKSTLLRAIALSWAEKSLAALKNEPIPLLIELRLYAQDKDAGVCNSFLEYLHKGNTACRLNQIELNELLKSGKAIALFDGVDEVFDPKLREAVVTDIHRFSNSYPQVPMVVTSRWLGYKAETLRKADFQHYMLQDLNAEQIEDFLERWHRLTFTAAQEEDKKRKQARLQKAITESKAIRELAGNPLLLTMMAILNRNQELPRDRARLYERASEVLLYQWDVEVKLHEQEDLKNWQIDVRDKQAMLRKVAHHMQANDDGLSGNVISREDLERILTKYLKTLEVDRARAVAKVMIEQLRERNFILCYLGADNYAFVHRTFLEYFCASEFVHQFEKERIIDEDELKELYNNNFQDEAWDEVLRLMAGMLDPRFIGKVIETLLNQSIEPVEHLDGHYIKREGFNHLFLAADCLAEVRSHHEISDQKNKLLKRLVYEAELQYPYLLSSDAASGIIKAISDNWKGKSETLLWLKRCLFFHKTAFVFISSFLTFYPLSSANIPVAAVQELARGWKDDPDTLTILKSRAQDDDNYAVRRAAVQELAHGWKDDPDTLTILKSRAQDDDNNDVRSAAVQELARGWKDDPDTLTILKSRAQDDDNNDVRSAAVQELARGWKDDPDTLTILKSRAQDDDNYAVRSAAVQELARGWKDDPDTLTILKSRAQDDDNYAVRRAAVQELARGWKDDPDTLTILKSRAQDDDNYAVRRAAVQELARGWKDDPDTLTILKSRAQDDEDNDVRRAAVQELARGWKDDPDTLTILKSRAQDDDNSAVRSAAVQELARGWKDDPDTLTWLKSRAQDDDNSAVRRAAVQELARGWKDDPDTLTILKSRAQDDEDNDVRRAAVQELARGWKDDPDTLTILKSRAQDDDNYAVRSAAVQELARGWKDDPDTLTWLKSRAQDDDNSAVRRAAVQELARGWKDDPDTLTILKSRAQDDEDNDVRRAAVQELARGWKDDPDTLTILKSRAQDDDNYAVRRAAVQELARGWKDDPDTLTILKSRAQDDDNNDVRRAAVQELARGWKDDPDTLTILKSRAQDDDNNDVRRAAVQELARGWKDDPDTLTILKSRAQDDDNYAVRSAAVQELARGWKDDPSLLFFFRDRTLQDPFKRKYAHQTNPRQIALQVLVQQYPTDPETEELLNDRAQNDNDKKLRTWATKQLAKRASKNPPK